MRYPCANSTCAAVLFGMIQRRGSIVAKLNAALKENGWVKTEDGWICSRCAKEAT